MVLSKPFNKIIGLGDMTLRALYDLIDEVDDRVEDVEAGTVAEDSIGASELNLFISTEVTGNGSAQNTAHGLGAIPGLVLVVPSATASGANTFVQGSHTSTNVIVTATTGAKYYVIAIG